MYQENVKKNRLIYWLTTILL